MLNKILQPMKISAAGVKYFYQKIGFDISCRLSPKETICMKYLILLVCAKTRLRTWSKHVQFAIFNLQSPADSSEELAGNQ